MLAYLKYQIEANIIDLLSSENEWELECKKKKVLKFSHSCQFGSLLLKIGQQMFGICFEAMQMRGQSQMTSVNQDQKIYELLVDVFHKIHSSYELFEISVIFGIFDIIH